MKYILKIYHHSKYKNYKRVEYKEFKTFQELQNYVKKNKISYNDHEIFINTNLIKI